MSFHLFKQPQVRRVAVGKLSHDSGGIRKGSPCSFNRAAVIAAIRRGEVALRCVTVKWIQANHVEARVLQIERDCAFKISNIRASVAREEWNRALKAGEIGGHASIGATAARRARSALGLSVA